jgi:TIR domain
MGRAIFISYRRDDTEGEAGRLYDDLVRTFSENSVFMDVAGINPGMDFRRAIDDNVASCGVLLAMIGPTWATISNGAGQRRLDDSNDFVRLEIASALARNIAVIPVLVHDARMPHADHLPENLKDLAYRNSVEITHARWNSDVQLLIGALTQYVGASKARSEEPVHATVSVQLPPANPPAPGPAIAKKSRMPLIAGLGVAAVLIIAAIAFFASHGSGSSDDSSGGTSVRPAPTEEAKPAERPDTSLEGTWTNPSPVKDNGLNKLEISFAGADPSVFLHAWAKCDPVDCDWGEQEGTVKGQEVTATWSVPPANETRAKGRVATVTVRPDGDSLSVEIVNEFPNGATVRKQFEFARAQ